MLELWNLMDTPAEEQQLFHHVTCNIAASEYEVTTPGALTLDVIEQVTLARIIPVQHLFVMRVSADPRDVCKKFGYDKDLISILRNYRLKWKWRD